MESNNIEHVMEALESNYADIVTNFHVYADVMCAELAGDFHLGDSRQLTDKSLLPFDLVS